MKIFREIKDSLYNPSFYQAHKNDSFGVNFSYLIKLILWAALIHAIILAIYAIPVAKIALGDALHKAVEIYPSDLTITIKNGQVSSNKQEPYAIPFPQDWKGDVNQAVKAKGQQLPENFLVIDTKSTSSVSGFESYKTLILLTKEYMIAEKGNGQLQLQKLNTVKDFTLTRADIDGWVTTIQPYFKWLIPFFILAYFVATTIGMLVGILAGLLVLSLITWLIAHLNTWNLDYAQSYILGLRIVTAPIILGIILALFGLNLPWYLYTIVFLISLFINMRSSQHS